MNRSESKYFNTARRMDEALLSLLEEKGFAYITVREICARAGVNRSTFYLHYENMSDLLRETVEMIDERFRASVADATDDKTGGERLAGLPREELFLLTDRRLLPYLDFIKRNRRVYAVLHAHAELFGVEKTYELFFRSEFSPILSRYGISEEKHAYMMAFYRHGLAAILMRWVQTGCETPAEEIAALIRQCVGTPREVEPR